MFRFFAVLIAALLLAPAGALAADLKVNSTADAVDASPGDGTCATADGACTLRAAVQEANSAGGAIAVPEGRYVLKRAPVPQSGSAAEIDPAAGDLDLDAAITVKGAGAGLTIIDGGGLDRVFEVGESGVVTISDLTVTGGDSTANSSQEIDLGGGILNRHELTLERVALIDNKADGGGGMFSIPATSPTIRDSLVARNTAYEGGGLRIDSGATIINTTITGNQLLEFDPDRLPEKPVGVVVLFIDEIAGYGGGIDHRGGNLLKIVNSTISGNRAVKGGGGLGAGQAYSPVSEDLPLGHVELRNTIIAGNTSAAGTGDCRTNEVKFVSLGHNLDTDGSCFLSAKGDRAKTDPKLGPLAANGGPTPTLALLRGSPAIDAGDAADCPKADARGTARPQGDACDIGAFEYRPCKRVIRLPARLRAKARSFRVVKRGARRAVVRVRLKSGRTIRRKVRVRCR